LIKGSLNPLFTINAIGAQVDRWAHEKEMEIYHELGRIGETFANAARDNHTYKDDTGALTGSIGYAVLKDGEVKDRNLKGSEDGKNAAKAIIQELALEYNKGWVLIGFAGMEYAAAVESKGYDVITGSAPVAEELIRTFEKELGANIRFSV